MLYDYGDARDLTAPVRIAGNLVDPLQHIEGAVFTARVRDASGAIMDEVLELKHGQPRILWHMPDHGVSPFEYFPRAAPNMLLMGTYSSRIGGDILLRFRTGAHLTVDPACRLEASRGRIALTVCTSLDSYANDIAAYWVRARPRPVEP